MSMYIFYITICYDYGLPRNFCGLLYQFSISALSFIYIHLQGIEALNGTKIFFSHRLFYLQAFSLSFPMFSLGGEKQVTKIIVSYLLLVLFCHLHLFIYFYFFTLRYNIIYQINYYIYHQTKELLISGKRSK